MKISVIIPTLNEEETLSGLLADLRSHAASRTFELVVADGGSTDRTLSVARCSADIVVECRTQGRAIQMHLGALASTGDVLLFLHADTRLPKRRANALSRLWNSSNPPAAAAFQLGFDAGGWRYRLIEKAARLRAALTGVPLGDQAISVRRDAYFAVGGFPDVPLMEEYYLLRKLRRRGRIAIIDQPVLTSARRFERNGPIRNSLRNTAITTMFLCGVPPRALARFYR